MFVGCSWRGGDGFCLGMGREELMGWEVVFVALRGLRTPYTERAYGFRGSI